MPLILLTTKVAKASPSTSSAIIRSALPDFATASKRGIKSFMFEIFLSNIRINGSSRATFILSWLLMKYGDKYPRSNCIPSTTSNSLSIPVPSSTVITPSFPTLSIASAIISPIAVSPFAEIEPTWAIAELSLHGVESLLTSSTAAWIALSIPLLRSIGFMPAATDFKPSFTIA